MAFSSITIYTIQTDKSNNLNLVEIETLVTKGLYKFTLLGMNPRHASDTKDRVYAALRSSDLLNLKSDNRKIIINLYPDTTAKNEGIYDLGIALSCVFAIQKIAFPKKIIALGGLSITGKIMQTSRLLQAIYTAYIEHIPIIVCSKTDVDNIDTTFVEEIKKYGITVIASDTLANLFKMLLTTSHTDAEHSTIQSNTCQALVNTDSSKENEGGERVYLQDLDLVTAGLYIALCGGHNIIIETCENSMFSKHYGPLYDYLPQKHPGRDMYTCFKEKFLDNDPKQNIIYIDNIKLKNYISEVSQLKDTIIATYTCCTCGYYFSFFDIKSEQRKCICSKKSIIQHKRHIENNYFSYFSLKTHHYQPNTQTKIPVLYPQLHKQIHEIRQKQYNTYIDKYNLTDIDSFFLPDIRYLDRYNTSIIPNMLDKEATELWLESNQDEKCLRVAMTIQHILDTEKEVGTLEKPAISKRALLLALSYIPKMDF